MATELITRSTPGLGATVKDALLTGAEVDANFISLNVNKLERENNLSDLTDTAAARAVLNVPSRSGLNAFGTWTISVTGNAGSATRLQNVRKINNVDFDGTSDITVVANTNQPLSFGEGISSPGPFNGSTARQITVDKDVVVTRADTQTITGTKTFNQTIVGSINGNAGSSTVLQNARTINGTSFNGSANITTNSWGTSRTLTIGGTGKSVNGGSNVSWSLTEIGAANRALNLTAGSGLTGGGNLTANRSFAVDSSVVRTSRTLTAGDGLNGGGTLAGNRSFAVDSSVVRTNGTSQNVRINSLGVGTNPSGTTGEIRATNNITAFFSDDRLKTRVGYIENAIDKLNTLTTFYYEPNERAQKLGYAKERHVGLSAQEVEKILPEVIKPAPIDEDYLTIQYEKLVPLLIAAIQELNKEIVDLKKEK